MGEVKYQIRTDIPKQLISSTVAKYESVQTQVLKREGRKSTYNHQVDC